MVYGAVWSATDDYCLKNGRFVVEEEGQKKQNMCVAEK